jgi:hypothetical protein
LRLLILLLLLLSLTSPLPLIRLLSCSRDCQFKFSRAEPILSMSLLYLRGVFLAFPFSPDRGSSSFSRCPDHFAPSARKCHDTPRELCCVCQLAGAPARPRAEDFSVSGHPRTPLSRSQNGRRTLPAACPSWARSQRIYRLIISSHLCRITVS